MTGTSETDADRSAADMRQVSVSPSAVKYAESTKGRFETIDGRIAGLIESGVQYEREKEDVDRDEGVPTRTYHFVTVIEYNETAEEYGYHPGERAVKSGPRREIHVEDDEEKGFVKVADAVAIIELHRPLTDDEVTEWSNSDAGKLALAHYFDHIDPREVASP